MITNTTLSGSVRYSIRMEPDLCTDVVTVQRGDISSMISWRGGEDWLEL